MEKGKLVATSDTPKESTFLEIAIAEKESHLDELRKLRHKVELLVYKFHGPQVGTETAGSDKMKEPSGLREMMVSLSEQTSKVTVEIRQAIEKLETII